MQFLKNLPDSQNNIMIFGHNNAFTTLANLLGTTYIDNLPTAGLVKLKLVDTEQWVNIRQGDTALVIIPKDLKQ